MYDLLQMDLEFGVFDKDSIYQFVGYGSITQAQYEQLTGQSAPGTPVASASTTAQSSANQPASSAPASSASQNPQSSSSEQTTSSSAPQPSNQPVQSSNATK